MAPAANDARRPSGRPGVLVPSWAVASAGVPREMRPLTSANAASLDVPAMCAPDLLPHIAGACTAADWLGAGDREVHVAGHRLVRDLVGDFDLEPVIPFR